MKVMDSGRSGTDDPGLAASAREMSAWAAHKPLRARSPDNLMHPRFAASRHHHHSHFHLASSQPSSNFGAQLAGIIFHLTSNSFILSLTLAAANMAEKAPLIPLANECAAERLPHVQYHCKGRSIGKLLTAGAAVALVYYSLPSCISNRFVAHRKSDLCLTPACVHAASEILYNLSPNYKELDPCEDFEELVCGGWRDRHDLRADQGDAFTGTIMSEQSELLLRHILEAPYPEDSEVCVFAGPGVVVLTLLAFVLFSHAARSDREVG